jgi:hypothetical protein
MAVKRRSTSFGWESKPVKDGRMLAVKMMFQSLRM